MSNIYHLLVDGLLIVGFGVQHSVLATVRVKSRIAVWLDMDALRWRSIQSFINVAYILLAIALWVPVSTVVWRLTGTAGTAMAVVCVASWLWYFEIHIVEYDAGLAFGSSAVISQLTKQKTPRVELWKVGSRRWLRFPVHTAFFPMFLSFPNMTASTLLFGVLITIYNVIGSGLYDRRLERLGPTYREYQKVTGLIFPRLTRPRGAVNLETCRPSHWSEPGLYTIPAVIGVLGDGRKHIVYV